MLVNKDFNNGDVISVKLVNGDELIARYVSSDEKKIQIYRPLVLTLGDDGMVMIPWMMLGVTESITLNKEHIFLITDSKKDAADQYLEHAIDQAVELISE